jgi:hypothetical protein
MLPFFCIICNLVSTGKVKNSFECFSASFKIFLSMSWFTTRKNPCVWHAARSVPSCSLIDDVSPVKIPCRSILGASRIPMAGTISAFGKRNYSGMVDLFNSMVGMNMVLP